MRLTDKQKAEVVTDFAAGKSKTDIARKFGISDVAVSKILKKYQSSEKVRKSSESSVTQTKRDQAEIRRGIIEKATLALERKDYESLAREWFER